jgi:general secretion pathway protein C
MRLAMNRTAAGRLDRLPRLTVYSAAELLLLALIAVQAARLVWTLVAPVGPVGDWRSQTSALPADGSALADFDPFFRLAQSGTATVTTLDLKLYGVREDRATGRGSAIIALPDGTQRSFAVGEEIVPGVTLAQVDFDNVTIDRNGSREQLFLDQSEPAPTAATAATTGAVPAPTASQPPPTAPPPIRLQPRMSGGQIDGVMVSPGGDGGQAFRSAGFVPGDVIVSINGDRITSMEQARALLNQSGGGANVIVERDGRAVPMRVRINP